MIKNNWLDTLHLWNLLSLSQVRICFCLFSWLWADYWASGTNETDVHLQRDWVLKYVLCNTLTTAFNFATFGAWKPQRTIVNVQVCLTPLIFHLFTFCQRGWPVALFTGGIRRNPWRVNKEVSPSNSFPDRWISKIVVLHKQKKTEGTSLKGPMYNIKRSNLPC